MLAASARQQLKRRAGACQEGLSLLARGLTSGSSASQKDDAAPQQQPEGTIDFGEPQLHRPSPRRAAACHRQATAAHRRRRQTRPPPPPPARPTGFHHVPRDEKQTLVGQVFSSVAPSYDVMNDLMSGRCCTGCSMGPCSVRQPLVSCRCSLGAAACWRAPAIRSRHGPLLAAAELLNPAQAACTGCGRTASLRSCGRGRGSGTLTWLAAPATWPSECWPPCGLRSTAAAAALQAAAAGSAPRPGRRQQRERRERAPGRQQQQPGPHNRRSRGSSSRISPASPSATSTQPCWRRGARRRRRAALAPRACSGWRATQRRCPSPPPPSTPTQSPLASATSQTGPRRCARRTGLR